MNVVVRHLQAAKRILPLNKLVVVLHKEIIFFLVGNADFPVARVIEVNNNSVHLRTIKFNLVRLRHLPKIVEVTLQHAPAINQRLVGKFGRHEIFCRRISRLKLFVNFFSVYVFLIYLVKQIVFVGDKLLDRTILPRFEQMRKLYLEQLKNSERHVGAAKVRVAVFKLRANVQFLAETRRVQKIFATRQISRAAAAIHYQNFFRLVAQFAYLHQLGNVVVDYRYALVD